MRFDSGDELVNASRTPFSSGYSTRAADSSSAGAMNSTDSPAEITRAPRRRRRARTGSFGRAVIGIAASLAGLVPLPPLPGTLGHGGDGVTGRQGKARALPSPRELARRRTRQRPRASGHPFI